MASMSLSLKNKKRKPYDKTLHFSLCFSGFGGLSGVTSLAVHSLLSCLQSLNLECLRYRPQITFLSIVTPFVILCSDSSQILISRFIYLRHNLPPHPPPTYTHFHLSKTVVLNWELFLSPREHSAMSGDIFGCQ